MNKYNELIEYSYMILILNVYLYNIYTLDVYFANIEIWI